MTLDDVRTVKEQVEREGLTPSCNLILERLGKGSKRDVVRLIRQLHAAGPGDAVVEKEEAPAPLQRARHTRDQTAAAERTLGEQEQRLKLERQVLANHQTQLAIQAQTVRTDAAEEARRRQVLASSTELSQVEAQRQLVHLKRQHAHTQALQAADQYSALAGQAARWLRRLRLRQREAHTLAQAWARGAAREECEQAHVALAALIGQAEAEALAADPTLHPDWGKD